MEIEMERIPVAPDTCTVLGILAKPGGALWMGLALDKAVVR